MNDYQWPSQFLTTTKYDENLAKENSFKIVAKIEDFFKERFGYFVILTPSARSGISQTMSFLGSNKGSETLIPLWSSNCLLNTISSHSIPTTENNKNIRFEIIVHKWGKIYLSNSNNIKIEDSVDSIVLNKNAIFPNNGEVEIFSLPKIIGSISGGLIVTRNIELFKKLKNNQLLKKELAHYQTKLKFEKNDKLENWQFHESNNSYLDNNLVNNIYNSLDNFELNKNVIQSRYRKVVLKFPELSNHFTGRLGPVIPFNCNKFQSNNEFKFIYRMNNYSDIPFSKEYEKSIILPLHYKISDQLFSLALNSIRRI